MLNFADKNRPNNKTSCRVFSADQAREIWERAASITIRERLNQSTNISHQKTYVLCPSSLFLPPSVLHLPQSFTLLCTRLSLYFPPSPSPTSILPLSPPTPAHLSCSFRFPFTINFPLWFSFFLPPLFPSFTLSSIPLPFPSLSLHPSLKQSLLHPCSLIIPSRFSASHQLRRPSSFWRQLW